MLTVIKLFVAICLVSLGIVAQGKPPKGDPDVSVTTVFDSSVPNLRIAGDELGTYENGLDGTESIIQGIGDWVLNTRNSSVRKVYIDFGDPVTQSEPAAPFTAALRPARLISKCAQVGFKIRDLQVGQTRNCPLALAFDSNGINYRIALNDANFSVTDFVQWTCLGSSGGRCVSWVMEPAAFYNDVQRSIGQLIRVGDESEKSGPTARKILFFFPRLRFSSVAYRLVLPNRTGPPVGPVSVATSEKPVGSL